MQSEPYVYRPGTGRDPQLMEMQARTYGWHFVQDSGSRPPHKPCMSSCQAWQLFLMVLLVLLFSARAQAQSWVTVDTISDSAGGLSYTLEVQLDTSTVSPTLNKVRTVATLTGTPGSSVAIGIALWNGPYASGTLLSSNTYSTFPQILTSSSVNLSPGGQRTISAGIIGTPGAPDKYATWVFDATPEVKRVRVSYFNSRDYPVTIRLVDSADPDTVIHEAVVAARSGFIQTITLPDGVDAVLILEQVDDFVKDGPTWVVSEGGSTTVTNATTVNGSTVYPGQNPPTTEVPQSPSLPSTPPTPGTSTPTPTPGGTVQPRPIRPWQPRADVATPTEGVTSDFTIVAYREGVDKLAEILEGSDPLDTPAEVTGESGLAVDMSKMSATTLSAKLPSAPTFSAITPSTSITIAFTIPKLGGGEIEVNKTVNFAAEPYATPISLFRGSLNVLLILTFFVLTLFTVRGALAGK